MPLGPDYDKLIDSKFADMKNTGGRHGGSITAAQFLQRFVDGTPWAHLDIAGTAMGGADNRHQPPAGAPATACACSTGWSRTTTRAMKHGSMAEMTEVLFYHLQDMTLESVLPPLLEKSLERGWRVVVQIDLGGARRRARCASVDLSATIRSCRTAPGATGDAGEQPVVLSVASDNPNGANVRFLVDGAALPDDAGQYERLVLVFNGDDDEALTAARTAWSDCKARGFEVTYWQADERGSARTTPGEGVRPINDILLFSRSTLPSPWSYHEMMIGR